ncbi:MAG: SpoIID/LytB domain-containing protein, partial [Clostridia bacterium]|nr:SpoIID/LytB domain-containing protein [Clostridia bacterium]
MKQCMIWTMAAVLAILLIPTAKRNASQRQRIPVLELTIEDTLKEDDFKDDSDQHEEKTVRLLKDGTVYEYPEQVYLTAVVLCEMPPDFEPEALKAQAVAARTFARKQMQSGKHETADVCSDPACCQA